MKHREEIKRKARRKELVKYEQNMSDPKGKKKSGCSPRRNVKKEKKERNNLTKYNKNRILQISEDH